MLLAPQIFEQRGRFSRCAGGHRHGHHSRREGRPDPLHHPNAQLQRADRLSPITGDVQGAGDLKLPRQSAVLLWKLMLSPVDLHVDLDLRRFLVVAGQTCRDQGRLEGRHLSMEITLELLEVLEFVASGNGAKDALGNEPLERLEGWTGKRIGALILSLHGRPPHFFPPKKILRGLVSEDPRIPGGSARFKPLFPTKMAICHKRTGSDNLTPLKSRSNRCTPIPVWRSRIRVFPRLKPAHAARPPEGRPSHTTPTGTCVPKRSGCTTSDGPIRPDRAGCGTSAGETALKWNQNHGRAGPLPAGSRLRASLSIPPSFRSSQRPSQWPRPCAGPSWASTGA